MATSSIYTNVVVRNKKGVKRLADALERSRASKAKSVQYSRSVEIVEDPETIRKMFGDKANGRIQDHQD